MTLERGILINNRYRIVEILGQGGMGSVYRAVDENLGVEVALKENLFTTEEYARQFHREAVILATLRHSNLTRVTDHFVIEGQGQYLVMDYIEGEDLRQRMDRVGLINEEEAVIIGAAICDALTYMHTRTPAVVHRDIKPGNVKITPHGQIFIVDFGLAKLVHTDQVTTTGARAMTPGYSPPEQYGTARTDHRSDIFSLGATLYAALTGAIPEDALARAMDQSTLTQLRKRNPGVSRRLAAIIEKSLEVRPDDRYQTAEEFKQALLSVRGITTRRRKGEYKVEPPPEEVLEQLARADKTASDPISSEYVAPPGSFAGLMLNGNASVGEAVLTPSRRASGWLTFSLLLLFIVAVGAAAYIIYPSWPAQALALIRPVSTTPIPVAIIDTNATPTGLAIAVTENLPTGTQESGATQVSNPAPTQPPTPTSTPRPTRTPVPPPPSATWTAVPTQIGGGSGQIAFASDRSGSTQVWLMNVDGTGEAQQITDLPEGACQPTWSPDGLQLLFISPCEGQQAIYPGAGIFLINADGTGMTPLPNVYGGDFDPAWSPDGRYIAFSSLRNVGRPRIYLLDLQDGSVKRLSETYSFDWQPAWSPDGNKIAFVTTQKGPVQIWIMDLDGTNQEIYSRSASAINTHPIWSLDGEVILFNQSLVPGGMPYLVAASYNDGQYNEIPYDLGPIPVREARYSPDGLWLVYESWPSGSNHDIYIMSASGAGRLRLTTWERFDFDPAWRPAIIQP